MAGTWCVELQVKATGSLRGARKQSGRILLPELAEKERSEEEGDQSAKPNSDRR